LFNLCNIALTIAWAFWLIKGTQLVKNELILADPTLFSNEVNFINIFFIANSVIIWIIIIIGMVFNNVTRYSEHKSKIICYALFVFLLGFISNTTLGASLAAYTEKGRATWDFEASCTSKGADNHGYSDRISNLVISMNRKIDY